MAWHLPKMRVVAEQWTAADPAMRMVVVSEHGERMLLDGELPCKADVFTVIDHLADPDKDDRLPIIAPDSEVRMISRHTRTYTDTWPAAPWGCMG